MKNKVPKLKENGYNINEPAFVAGSFDDSNKHLIQINSYSVFGEESHIVTHCPTMINNKFNDYGVVIDKYSWTGFRCIILPGVRVSKASIIGAGSIVTKSTEPFGVYAGNPAKFIRYRTPEEIVSIFIVRWLMEESLKGKYKPNYNLLTLDYLNDIFKQDCIGDTRNLNHPLRKILYHYKTLDGFLEYLQNERNYEL